VSQRWVVDVYHVHLSIGAGKIEREAIRVMAFAIGARVANQSGRFEDCHRGDEGVGARGISTNLQIPEPARRQR
jgi:hypothetical protein